MDETRLHLFRPGRERTATAEVRRVLGRSSHALARPGVIESRLKPDDERLSPALAFVSQVLPQARELSAPSVSKWAELVAGPVIDALATHEAPWRLHVFVHDGLRPAMVSRRCRLIDEALTAVFRRKQRRLVRARLSDESPQDEREALVQLCMTSPETGFLSICRAGLRHQLRRCLSRFPGGELEVPFDRRPPSRAYLKLLEAQARMGRAIHGGETCVDLGASPGGWTFVALDQGGRVTAVDRSPLRPDLMRHPGLTFSKGDAFKFAAPKPVDWLLCDVIAFPERTLDLVERWIAPALCRFFVVTMKFRGEADFDQIEELTKALESSGAEFEIRQLNHNKNEVTAFGRCTKVPPSPEGAV